jgi:hypothetical protein
LPEEISKKIQRVVDQVHGVISCQGSWAVDYKSALKTIKKVLEKRK